MNRSAPPPAAAVSATSPAAAPTDRRAATTTTTTTGKTAAVSCVAPAPTDRGAATATTGIAAEPAGLALTLMPRWLIARFATEHTTASWAIVGGGLGRARAVAWHEVRDGELAPAIDPAELLRDRLAALGLAGAVGLLTSRRLDRYVDTTVRHGELAARCIATVGLGNALRAGDPPGTGKLGTINLLCQLDAPLSPEAQLEALALAAEARTLAVREALVPSTRSGLPASGTGTDCIVIAAPVAADPASPAAYAGKHTAIGHVIGAAVHDATRRGIARWLREARAREAAR
jgi:adenosylcobinamide amidohydrolase